jgi:hypothetical protein
MDIPTRHVDQTEDIELIGQKMKKKLDGLDRAMRGDQIHVKRVER